MGEGASNWGAKVFLGASHILRRPCAVEARQQTSVLALKPKSHSLVVYLLHAVICHIIGPRDQHLAE